MTNEKYNVKITDVQAIAGKTIGARERIILKDLGDAKDIVNEIASSTTGSIVISPVAYAELDIHNEYSKPSPNGDKNVDYKVFVVLTADGTKYKTSSRSFTDTFIGIWEEVTEELTDGEMFEVKCYGIPSKNFKGNNILTCSLV